MFKEERETSAKKMNRQTGGSSPGWSSACASVVPLAGGRPGSDEGRAGSPPSALARPERGRRRAAGGTVTITAVAIREPVPA
jgi:hypothetical protein